MTAMTIPTVAGPDTLGDARATPAVLRKVLTASFIGNFVEWFDYASYGYFATVIAVVFFPEIAPSAALLATFAVFAISFIIRPIGGIVWGSIGDRIGRKTALSWSILIMSGATTLIAFLPGYAQIGFAAPILLLVLRMVQGFSASGEYAGAASFLAEYAPSEKRGFYTSMVPASTAAGLLAGSLMSALLFEFVATFLFVTVILGATQTDAPAGFAGLAIGLTLAGIHLVGIDVTGVSVNPARSIGPAIFAGGQALSQLWLFILAPLAGGALAGALHGAGITRSPHVKPRG